MSKLTLDEAIKHCLEVTNEKSEQAELWKSKDEATISRNAMYLIAEEMLLRGEY